MIKHIKQWNRWRKYNANSWLHKLLVLFGFIGSPTFYIVNDTDWWDDTWPYGSVSLTSCEDVEPVEGRTLNE